jgi:hypothetical protein
LLTLAGSFFTRSALPDRERILEAVAKGSKYHLESVIKALQQPNKYHLDPAESLDRIIFGIPSGQHMEVADNLRSRGLNKEADRVIELEDEPPF